MKLPPSTTTVPTATAGSTTCAAAPQGRRFRCIIQKLNIDMDERQSLRAARELKLISEIEHDPDATQIGLAQKLGVAVGTVNWHLKRMVAKGYVKVKRAERRKLRYILTRSG